MCTILLCVSIYVNMSLPFKVTSVLDNLSANRGIQVIQIREALCWREWCLALISVI